MKILYGGAFNPPTIAHLQIMQFLFNKYPNCELIIIPANDFYRENEMVSKEHRLKMLQLTCNHLTGKYLISNFELEQETYMGTYYTLEYFNHPFFVIGADQLYNISKWKNYPQVVKDNKFIVFPRGKQNINDFLMNDDILSKLLDHFIILNDFENIPISSTIFRITKNKSIVTKEVFEYIEKNKLYEVK